jgi:hypothetical protein
MKWNGMTALENILRDLEPNTAIPLTREQIQEAVQDFNEAFVLTSKVHQAVGIETAYKMLIDRAGKEFSDGKDLEAYQTRELAKFLLETSKKQCQEAAHYDKIITDKRTQTT